MGISGKFPYDGNEPGTFQGFGQIGAPDYANRESVNRITANNGTWTADRDGYVYLDVSTVSAHNAAFYINTKEVAANYEALKTTRVFKVSKGDTVRMNILYGYAAGANSCLFIPPINDAGSVAVCSTITF